MVSTAALTNGNSFTASIGMNVALAAATPATPYYMFFIFPAGYTFTTSSRFQLQFRITGDTMGLQLLLQAAAYGSTFAYPGALVTVL